MNIVLIALLIVAVIVGELISSPNEVVLGTGVMVPEAPQQENISPPVSFNFDDFNITEIAKFDIKAKVLSKENYYFDRESEISPTDLALGWGNMSDESLIQQIDISQSRRFYWARWPTSHPISKSELATQSANMHLIPADDTVKDIIDEVRKGDIVQISGSLVNIKNDVWYWNTSLTRKDRGDGSCELIFVREISIVTP